MGRCKGANGKGQSEAIRLVLWYWEMAQIPVAYDRRDVNRMKAILERAGDMDKAQAVLSFHLRDKWRFANRKPLCFVQAAMSDYLVRLGFEMPIADVVVQTPVRRAPHAVSQ
jgi:hypothetical protein